MLLHRWRCPQLPNARTRANKSFGQCGTMRRTRAGPTPCPPHPPARTRRRAQQCRRRRPPRCPGARGPPPPQQPRPRTVQCRTRRGAVPDTRHQRQRAAQRRAALMSRSRTAAAALKPRSPRRKRPALRTTHIQPSPARAERAHRSSAHRTKASHDRCASSATVGPLIGSTGSRRRAAICAAAATRVEPVALADALWTTTAGATTGNGGWRSRARECRCYRHQRSALC